MSELSSATTDTFTTNLIVETTSILMKVKKYIVMKFYLGKVFSQNIFLIKSFFQFQRVCQLK